MKIVDRDPNPQPSFLGIIPKDKLEQLTKCADEVGMKRDDLLAFLDPMDADGEVIKDHFAIYTEEKNMNKSAELWEKYQVEELINGN
jgi:hypothetical protein